MKRSRALKSLIASRMAFGVAIWTLPGPVGKAFGVDMTRDPLAAAAAGRNGLSKRTTAMLLAASLGPMVRGAIVLREQ